ncbi:MAG: hypothetical protein WC269_02135 [Candidatus Gracilibacteria bacterium]|jgi:acetylornithine deacetylase/succinyl-diaminopimelate desuccinylase-like protein
MRAEHKLRTAEPIERFKDNRTLGFAHQIAQNGVNDDGKRTALAYSPEEDAAMGEFKKIGHELKQLAETKGMKITVEEDTFGNCYVTLKGQESNDFSKKQFDKEILLGSHVDSLKEDSKYDGTLGVGMGLETLRRFIDKGIVPKYSLKVAAFRAQKSAITKRAFLGSALATGKVWSEGLKELPYMAPTFTGGDGGSLFDVVSKKRGITENQFKDAVANPFLKDRQFRAAIEVHIDNGSTLEDREVPCAIVSAIGGSRRGEIDVNNVIVDNSELASSEYRTMRMVIKGKPQHSGATPMTGELINGNKYKRSDALVSLSKFLNDYEGNRVVDFGVRDGAYNMVPGEAFVDLRVPKDGREAKDVVEMMRQFLEEGMVLDVSYPEEKESEHGKVNFIREEVVRAVTNIVLLYEKTASSLAVGDAGESQGYFRATVGGLEIDKKARKIRMLTDERVLSDILARRFVDQIHFAIRKTRNDLEKALEQTDVSLEVMPFREGRIIQMEQSALKGLAEHVFVDMANDGDARLEEMWSMPGYDVGVPEARDKLLLLVRANDGSVDENDVNLTADLLFHTLVRYFEQPEFS